MAGSGVSVRGVPVEAIHEFTQADVTNPFYLSTQARFDALRGEGTGLLPAEVVADIRGPAPYLRELVKSLVAQQAGGDEVNLANEETRRFYAELYLALSETLAAAAAAVPESWAKVFYVAPSSPAPLPPFAAFARLRPEWLTRVLLRSIYRTSGVPEAALEDMLPPALPEQTDPLLRIARESEFWRSVSPHGSDGLIQSKAKADALAGAVDSAKVYVPEVSDPDLQRLEGSGDDWLTPAKALLASKVSATDQLTRPVPPGGDGLAASVLRRFAQGIKEGATEEGREVTIVSSDSIGSVLPTIDVMRDYVIKPV